ncbi:MAG: TetR/AcrR family transcriptional regulator [Gammaproteobacteria bacterium]|nr:MAG: TetR/AcrR family transcriptional regulator [Gammaproteobacteria bacterium]
MEQEKKLKRASTEESKEIRKRSILNAGMELFLSNPTELPTVSAISKHCNIAKGTIYIYFKTKEEIFLNIIDDLFNQFVETTHSIILSAKSDSTSCNSKIEFIVNKWCDYYAENSMMVMLAGMSNNIIENNIDIEAAAEHKKSLQKQVLSLGETLSEVIDKDNLFCASLLIRSYAITIGISRISNLPSKVRMAHKDGAEFIAPEFRSELFSTLLPFWKGSLV